MLTILLSVLAVLAPLAITALLCVVAYRRTRAEPRRLSNAYWLLAAGVALVSALGGLGVPGVGALGSLAALIVIMAPLLTIVLVVFLIANGVTMARRESRSLGNLLSLLLGLALLAVVVITVPVVLSLQVDLILGWGLVLLLVGYAAFHFVAFLAYAALYPRLVRGRPTDWVVVLGSGLGEGGRVPPLLASRVRTGMAEAARRGARLLIMSGGQGDDEARPEADAMAEWAIDNGADPAIVLRETASRTTEQNLALTSALLPAASGDGLIVTSNYHVMRAATLARRLGIPAQATGAPTAGYYWPSAMIREFVAIVVEQRRAHAIVLGALMVMSVGLVVALRLAGG